MLRVVGVVVVAVVLLLPGALVAPAASAAALPGQPDGRPVLSTGGSSTAVAAPAPTGPGRATAWAWPLESGSGPPQVLRRAALPDRPWRAGHRGVDLAAVPGQPVLAPVDGVVVAAGPVAGRGVVSVRAASGWRATLEPVDARVAVGDRVVRGQVVGALSARDGHCGSAACLHWGVRTGSGAATRYRDPLALLRPRVRLLPVPGWGLGGAQPAERRQRAQRHQRARAA
ncbi:peptidoglycan DD-metalloendopeptidase family protein [Quadrisphaera sp. KR29]|uniref:peptidoglycan DD-metalloendopeptidase family protein n=1 Tax=Quadrisphaera sp. KR29 TaxID=3461391 RepID=UPI0040440DFF